MRFLLGFLSSILACVALVQVFIDAGPASTSILGFGALGMLVGLLWLGPGRARTGWADGWLAISLLLTGLTPSTGRFLGELASGRRWGCGNGLRAEMAMAQFYFFMVGSGILSFLRVLRTCLTPLHFRASQCSDCNFHR